MVHTPSFGTWYHYLSLERHMAPKFSSSEIGSCEQISSSSWHLTTNINVYFFSLRAIMDVLVTRSILEELRLPFTSSISWQPFSDADVGICETTQGNDFDLQRTTQSPLALICRVTINLPWCYPGKSYDDLKHYFCLLQSVWRYWNDLKALRSVICQWIASIFLRSSGTRQILFGAGTPRHYTHQGLPYLFLTV